MQGIIVTAKFIIGCLLLAWGAERFIDSSIAIAKRLGWSPLTIGMLLVGFGTSFPEIVVSGLASYHGTPELAIGNAIGSNIMNCGMVLGISALILPLAVHSRILKREFPILIAIVVLVGILLANGYLSRLDGVVLVIALVAYLYWMMRIAPQHNGETDTIAQEFEQELSNGQAPLWRTLMWWFIGLALLFISSEMIVDAAVTIAKWLQVSDLVIGLTIVAIGTSLPELAASVMSTIKKEHDIAIGNIVGSNIFNLLAVLTMPAFIAPTKLPSSLIYRDYPIMTVFILATWVLAMFPRKNKQIGRLAGLILTLGFIGYIAWIAVTATNI